MQNVTMRTEGNKLIVEIDLTKRCGASKTGKTTIVASTGGNAPIPGYPEIRVGVNAYTAR